MMLDSDKMISDLFDIAHERKIRVYYKHLLPDEESFIVSHGGESYIYLEVCLNGFAEIKHFAHEVGHDFVGISDKTTSAWLSEAFERRACEWAVTYLIKYDEFIQTLQNPFVRNDFEAAEELGVDIETVERVRQYYERKDLKVRQCDVVNWWDFVTT